MCPLRLKTWSIIRSYVLVVCVAIGWINLRSITRFLGLLVFIILALAGVGLVLVFFDLSGAHPRPVLIDRLPSQGPDFSAVKTLISGGGIHIEYSNPPLPDEVETPDLLPTTSTPPALPTVTVGPPLDPVIYRTEVTLRAKTFAAALDSFLDLNDELMHDGTLPQDAEWRTEMSTVLAEVVASAQALGQVGPPPPEYSLIQSWLERVAPQAGAMQYSYQKALETGQDQDFNAAGEYFEQIKGSLAQALAEMGRAGWPLE